MNKIRIIGLLLSVLCATQIFAGTQAVMKEYKHGKATGESMTLSIDGDFLKIDNSSVDDKSLVIFNNTKMEMQIIDTENKSYTRMDKASIEKMSKKLDDAKKQMDAHLAQMPAAQRDMMRSMMGKMLGDTNKIVTKLVKTSRAGKVGNNTCKISEIYTGAIKSQEFCITPTSNLDGSEEILLAMKNLSSMFRQLFESMAKSFPGIAETNPFNELDKMDGFPIIVTTFKGNKVSSRNELVSIKSKSFDKGFFTVPSNYKENKINLGN